MTHYDRQVKKWKDNMNEYPEFSSDITKCIECNKKVPWKESVDFEMQKIKSEQMSKWASQYLHYKFLENMEVQIPPEMMHFIDVLYHSANIGKYPANNWLEKDGMSCEHKKMYASMFRHLAEANCGSKKDKDSGLHPLLHLATRALMTYTRYKKGLDK